MTGELQRVRASGVIEDEQTSYTYRKPRDRQGDWLLGDLEDIAMHARGAGADDTTKVHITYNEALEVNLPVPAYQITPVKYSNAVTKKIKEINGRKDNTARGTIGGLVLGVPITVMVMLGILVSPMAFSFVPLLPLLVLIYMTIIQ